MNVPLRKLFRWVRRLQLRVTGDWQLHHDNVPHSCITSCADFFGETLNHPADSAPYSLDLVPCDIWLFPKLKSTLKGKRFQTVSEIKENTTGQLMAIGRTVWGPKMPTLKGTETSLSYAEFFLHLVSSSINVSKFYITWLDTFWTDLVHPTEICSTKHIH